MPLFFTYVPKSALGDGTRGAGIGARTAVDASFIDFVFEFAFADSAYWAYRSTRTTFNTFVTDQSHSWTPPHNIPDNF